MHSRSNVRRLVRDFLDGLSPQDDTSIDDFLLQFNTLKEAENIDLCDAFVEELVRENVYQRLVAAQFLLNAFPYNESINLAIESFQSVLKSNDSDMHWHAFLLLMATQRIPSDLMPSVKPHMDAKTPAGVAATIVATEFDELRARAFGFLGKALESVDLSDAWKKLVAIRMIRLNYGVTKAWQILDELSTKSDDPNIHIDYILGLSGVCENPEHETIQRILSMARELATTDNAALQPIFVLLGTIKTNVEEIDQFLLSQIDPATPGRVMGATLALVNRQSTSSETAQGLLVELLSATETPERELGAMSLLRCFHCYSESTIQSVVERLKIERDLEVVELLMKVCGKAGAQAFPYLLEDWKEPESLRDWLCTMTLASMGEESITELLFYIVENPSENSRRLMAHLIKDARFESLDRAAKLKESLQSVDDAELRTVLVAMQNCDANAVYLVPELISIASRQDKTDLSDLASAIIHSIGPPALQHFPLDDNSESPQSLRQLRTAIEAGTADETIHILHDAKQFDLVRFRDAGRLIDSGECGSLREAAGILSTVKHKNETGWSFQSINRARQRLERHLSDCWERSVVLTDTAVGNSTSPTKLTREGRRVLMMIEQYIGTKDT